MTIDYQNDLGITLLHVAAQNGNKRIAKLCLRKGADVNRRNHNGQVRMTGQAEKLVSRNATSTQAIITPDLRLLRRNGVADWCSKQYPRAFLQRTDPSPALNT